MMVLVLIALVGLIVLANSSVGSAIIGKFGHWWSSSSGNENLPGIWPTAQVQLSQAAPEPMRLEISFPQGLKPQEGFLNPWYLPALCRLLNQKAKVREQRSGWCRLVINRGETQVQVCTQKVSTFNRPLLKRIAREFFPALETIQSAKDPQRWAQLYEAGVMDPEFLALCLQEYQPEPASYQSLPFLNNLDFQLDLAPDYNWWSYRKFFEMARRSGGPYLYLKIFKKLLPNPEVELAFWETFDGDTGKISTALQLLRSRTSPEYLHYWLQLEFDDTETEVNFLFDLLRRDGFEKHIPWLIAHNSHWRVQGVLNELSHKGLLRTGSLSLEDIPQKGLTGGLSESKENGEDS